MEVGEGRFPAVIVTGNQAASGNVPDHVLGDECGQSTGVAVVEGGIASPHDLDVGGFGEVVPGLVEVEAAVPRLSPAVR
jgi:hypothetical protein